MLTIEKPSLMWALVCPVTGIVLSESWGTTEPYARSKTEKMWGKRRMEWGEMRLCRVTVQPVSDEEVAAHRAEFEAWKEGRSKRTAG